MKKKIFLTFLVVSVLVFLFAITIGAKENYNYEYTLSNKTTLIHYNQFNYTKGESQVISNTVNKDDELVEALLALGYKNADIKKVLPKIDCGLAIEDKIKDALRIMLK